MTDKARQMMNEKNKENVALYWERRIAKTGKTKSELRRLDEIARWERKANALKPETQQAQVLDIIISQDGDVQKDDEMNTPPSRNGMSDTKYINFLIMSNNTLRSENRRLQRLLTRYQEIINIGVNQYVRNHEKMA